MAKPVSLRIVKRLALLRVGLRKCPTASVHTYVPSHTHTKQAGDRSDRVLANIQEDLGSMLSTI